MKHKKIIFLLFSFIICLILNFQLVSADSIKRGDIYQAIGNALEIPESYNYINLYYSDITSENNGFSGLQKLVYSGKLKNKISRVYPEKYMSKQQLYSLLKATADKNLATVEYLKSAEGFVETSDLEIIPGLYGTEALTKITLKPQSSNIDEEKLKILHDVYDTLNSNHYDSADFNENDLINSAIDGLTKGTKDSYTSYFPPAENKNFQDGLQGEYEGIGAYVDMPEPGIVVIVSPISGSPAEAAGLKGGDIIYSVNEIEVKKNENLSQVTSRIKGPAGTEVNLGVLRDGKKKSYLVTRGKILLKDVIGEKLNSSSYYIGMKMFTGNIAEQFGGELKKLETQKGIKKIIIDLRNNPGGYLDQVIDILGHFIPQGEPVAVVKYKNSQQTYKSFGYEGYDFNNKKIVILLNGGTASASEIFAGTLKDYFPQNVTLIGERSFGKGSVQTQRYYKDGSALKYTIAKWYTGKSEKGIDEVGIQPDVEVAFDQELWDNKKQDSQLIRALNH